MRAGDFVTEIERLPQNYFAGGKESMDLYNPNLHRNLKPLPGK